MEYFELISRLERMAVNHQCHRFNSSEIMAVNDAIDRLKGKSNSARPKSESELADNQLKLNVHSIEVRGDKRVIILSKEEPKGCFTPFSMFSLDVSKMDAAQLQKIITNGHVILTIT